MVDHDRPIREAACVLLFRPRTIGAESANANKLDPAERKGSLATDVEVYLARRSRQLAFLGGFDVFPGGVVDEADARFGEAWGYRLAAVRELFEETGVFLPEPQSNQDLDALRRRVLDHGALPFYESLGDDGAASQKAPPQPDHLKDSLWPMGVWVTPPYTPMLFRAQYFGAWLPAKQNPEIWPGELEDGGWYSPAEALRLHEEGGLFISYPVLETLRLMMACACGDGAQTLGSQLQRASDVLEAREEAHEKGGGELLHGLHVVPVRTPTLPPATHTNCYVLGGQELVVVDPACYDEDEQGRLIRYLRHLQDQGATLKAVWLTHHHADHIGAVKKLQSEFGLPLWCHAACDDALGDDFQAARHIQDDEVLELALTRGMKARWRALHTPGHAPGHLCFFEESRGILISGDNVVGVGTVLIGPPYGDMAQYLASLQRMLQLPAHLMFPAHGPPMAAVQERIQYYIDHRLQREASILGVLEGASGRPMDVMALVERVYVDLDPRAFPLAKFNVDAHLQKLLDEGRVVAKDNGYIALSVS